jgi:hypothetical protein
MSKKAEVDKIWKGQSKEEKNREDAETAGVIREPPSP